MPSLVRVKCKPHRQVMVLMLVWLFGSIGKGIWDTILDKLEP